MEPAEGVSIPITVTCTQCHRKQVVQVRHRSGSRHMSGQVISCANCKKEFAAMVPDDIVSDPVLSDSGT